MILSAIFVILLILPPAIPAYLLAAGQSHARLLNDARWIDWMPTPLWSAVGMSLLLTAAVTSICLRMGFRAFERLELC